MIKNKKGFTLLEILLVVAAIAILAGIVIIAINPSKQLGDARDAQRRVDVNTILNAVYQYMIDNGSIPNDTGEITTGSSCATATGAEFQICPTPAVTDCGEYADLSDLTDDETYLVSMPIDPSASDSSVSTDYTIFYDSSTGRVTVCAPNTEQADTTISAKR